MKIGEKTRAAAPQETTMAAAGGRWPGRLHCANIIVMGSQTIQMHCSSCAFRATFSILLLMVMMMVLRVMMVMMMLGWLVAAKEEEEEEEEEEEVPQFYISQLPIDRLCGCYW